MNKKHVLLALLLCWCFAQISVAASDTKKSNIDLAIEAAAQRIAAAKQTAGQAPVPQLQPTVAETVVIVTADAEELSTETLNEVVAEIAAAPTGRYPRAKTSALQAKVDELEATLNELQEQLKPKDLGDLAITLDATYVTKYIWRGYDLFDDHAAFQPSVDVDLFGTGWSINVWGSVPLGTGSFMQSGGINQWQEYDYTVAYATSIFDETPYATELGINYIYYDFPKQNRHVDTQEVGLGAAWPNLISVGDVALVPSYYVGILWPRKSDDGTAGSYHTIALSADVPVPCPLSPSGAQTLSFFTDINYNDGLFGSEHVWSHATLGVSTSFDIKGIAISPSLNYQISMGDADDSVNDEDEFWGGVSVSYGF